MKRNRIKTIAASIAMLGAASTTGNAWAATEVQKQAAIDSGLAWLATQQAGNGSWCASGYCAADTASALLAYIEQKYKPTGWGAADYTAVVNNGLSYLMNTAGSYATAMKNIGTFGTPIMVNPDGNGNNLGLGWGGGEATYVTGLVLPALARATAGVNGINPGTVVASGNGLTNGRTYAQIIQDVADTFAWGQTTQNNGGPQSASNPGFRGGWRYTPSTGQSDGSTAQWGAIGLLFAQGVPGVTVPGFVKDELEYWIDYIQNSASGGAGYTHPNELVNESKTGGLLLEMAFTGYNGVGGPTDTGGVSNLAGALSYLNTNWTNSANSTWNGNFGHPYAMWSIYKGLEATIGLANTTAITNLLTTCGTLDPGDVCNWWQDYSEFLVNSQLGSGAWPGYSAWNAQLATAWSINILNATVVGPGAPEPSTIALAGLALAGLAIGRRRRAG